MLLCVWPGPPPKRSLFTAHRGSAQGSCWVFAERTIHGPGCRCRSWWLDGIGSHASAATAAPGPGRCCLRGSHADGACARLGPCDGLLSLSAGCPGPAGTAALVWVTFVLLRHKTQHRSCWGWARSLGRSQEGDGRFRGPPVPRPTLALSPHTAISFRSARDSDAQCGPDAPRVAAPLLSPTLRTFEAAAQMSGIFRNVLWVPTDGKESARQ